MKNFSIIFLAIAIAFSGVSCQSTSNDPYKQIERYVPYLRGSAMVITSSVFNAAISDKDKADKAKIVYDIATVIEQLTIDGDISVESIAETISKYLPVNSHWDEFAANIILIYADVYAQSQELEDQDSKRKILVKALNQIAGGCKAAAKIYVKD